MKLLNTKRLGDPAPTSVIAPTVESLITAFLRSLGSIAGIGEKDCSSTAVSEPKKYAGATYLAMDAMKEKVGWEVMYDESESFVEAKSTFVAGLKFGPG